jgi:hypothetical protein
MSWAVRVNAILTLVLAVLFGYGFNFLKHDAAVSRLIPFASDPYDSVGSLAAIVVLPLAVLALVRAFRSLSSHAAVATTPITVRKVRVARAQMAAVLAVFITMGADAVALIRHPARWSGASGSAELIATLLGLTVISAALGIAIRRTLDSPLPAPPAGASRRAGVATTVSIVVLALFPERIVNSVVGELMALATGVVLLFWLISCWLVVVVPGEVARVHDDQRPRLTRRPWLAWAAVVTVGLAVGTYLLWLESREDGGIAPGKFLLVACVFLGAGAFGLTTALAFLRKPLGLDRPD